MRSYRFVRVLRTLRDNFTGFESAFHEVVFEWAKEESSNLTIQPLPSSIKLEDISDFEYEELYTQLEEQSPILHRAVRGGMARNCSYNEVVNKQTINKQKQRALKHQQTLTLGFRSRGGTRSEVGTRARKFPCSLQCVR